MGDKEGLWALHARGSPNNWEMVEFGDGCKGDHGMVLEAQTLNSAILQWG